MKTPRKAVLLAAGFGSRLAPMTLQCPKPLVPFAGQPMLERVVQQLAGWGVKDICINLHHGAAAIMEALPGLDLPVRVTCSYEPDILGTGGVLRRLGWFLDDGPFWLCNADVATELNHRHLLRAYEQQNPLACLWMIPNQGPRTVSVRDERVVDFRNPVKGCERMTFSGLHLLSPEILRYLPQEETFSSIIDAYEEAMAQRKTIAAVTVPGSRWADLGTPDQLVDAHASGPVLWDIDSAPRGTNRLVTSPALGLWPEEHELFPDALAVEHLEARGSDRTFRRLIEKKRRLILIRSGSARPENLRFANHARFLAARGIRVPEIVVENHHLLAVEDFGDRDCLNVSRTARKRHMPAVIGLVARLHNLRNVSLPLEPPFSPALYRWERNLFFEQFLHRFDPGADRERFTPCFRTMARDLHKQPQVLLHRDLQSTNIMLPKGEVALIDFQGMRLGAAAYDLGSLFADPYIEDHWKQQMAHLDLYNQCVEQPVTCEIYALGAAQRLCQALGAFGRLSANPATQRFYKHIPAGVRQLQRVCQHHASLTPLRHWAEAYMNRNGI